jgi:hypothetical protein
MMVLLYVCYIGRKNSNRVSTVSTKSTGENTSLRTSYKLRSPTVSKSLRTSYKLRSPTMSKTALFIRADPHGMLVTVRLCDNYIKTMEIRPVDRSLSLLSRTVNSSPSGVFLYTPLQSSAILFTGMLVETTRL